VLLASFAIRLTVLIVLLLLAVVDVRERRLPNKGVVLIAILFFIDAAVIRMPIKEFLFHLLIGAGAMTVCAGLFAARMLGGGDAKLAAVIFMWVGPALSIPALGFVSVVGTVVSIVSLITQRMSQDQRLAVMKVLVMFSGARGVPYGVALALGGGAFILLPALLPLVLTR
jgi:prepilin peptidase CpaA